MGTTTTLLLGAGCAALLFVLPVPYANLKLVVALLVLVVGVGVVVARRLVRLLVRVLSILLALGDLRERLLRHRLGVLDVVGHEDVVKDGALVDDPQLEADRRQLRVLRVRLPM